MDAASLVSQGNGDGPRLAEVKVLAVVVVVRRDPAHPHGRRVLSGKHSHRVVVLGGIKHTVAQPHFLTPVFLKSLLSYRGDASVVSASVVVGRVTVKTKAVQEDI